MKNWKLVSGILCCVLSIMVLFQSCAASIGEAFIETGTSDGTAGLLLAILMLAGGIVSIATHKSTGKGGNIAMFILFLLAAVIGFSNSSFYADLAIWAAWCMICAVLAIVAIILGKRQATKINASSTLPPTEQDKANDNHE